jgi:hypothetical protein
VSYQIISGDVKEMWLTFFSHVYGIIIAINKEMDSYLFCEIWRELTGPRNENIACRRP